MPKSRRKNGKRSVRTRRRTGRRLNRKRFIPMQPTDKQKLIKHRFMTFNTLVPSNSGTVVSRIYRCMGANDPEEASGGNQPRYFDQMALLYLHYTCLGSKMTVRFSGATTTVVASPVTCGILVDAIETKYTGFVDTEEHFGRRSKLYNPNQGNTVTVINTFSLKKFFRVKSIASDRFRALSSTLPAEDAFYHIYVWPNNSVSTTINFNVTIDYILLWQEPIEPSQSKRKLQHEQKVQQDLQLNRSNAPEDRPIESSAESLQIIEQPQTTEEVKHECPD